MAEQQLNSGVVWRSADIRYGDLLDISKRNITTQRNQTILSRLLDLRGVSSDERESFLNPSVDDLHNPFLFKNMKKAVERIKNAIAHGECILIFGDYDVDGMTSTAILFSYLEKCGAKVEYHVPDRNEEGYGLSIAGLERIGYQRFGLIITVDCGISSAHEISWLKDRGIDVIVTDHHTYVSELSDVYTIVSVSEPDETYPFKMLAGVGVAFKVVQALAIEMGEPQAYYDYIELAALGTVADMVPLQNENRAIVSLGLSEMYDSKFKGISVLLQHMFMSTGSAVIDTDALGFFCCPRFNAAGRVGEVKIAMQLLLAEDESEAARLVDILEGYNLLRKECEHDVLERAEKQLLEKYDVDNASCFVLADEGWNEGVIGIVASRLCEKYNCPCVLISLKDGHGKGSCRSIEAVHLFECLEACSEYLEGFGGHKLAAGLTVDEKNIEAFERKLNQVVKARTSSERIEKTIIADIAVDSSEMNISNTLEIEKLCPFGEANKRPLMYGDFFRIQECRYIGRGNRHLKFYISKGGEDFTALLFNKGELMSRVIGCKYLNAIFNYSINSWRGADSFQMRLEDFKTLQWTRAMWVFYREFDKVLSMYASNKRLGKNKECNNIPKGNIAEAPVKLMELINANVFNSDNINVFVNDILSMDYVLKVVLKDIKYRCPIELHYGQDVIDDALLDIAPVDVLTDMPTIHIYANVLPEYCPKTDGINVIYGKWYNESYLNDVIAMIDSESVNFIGVCISNCNVFWPFDNDSDIVVRFLESYLRKNNDEIAFSKLERAVSNLLGKKINPYKLFKILQRCEQNNSFTIENVRGDVLRFRLV